MRKPIITQTIAANKTCVLCDGIVCIYIAILLRVIEYYSVTLFELTVAGGCTDVFEAVELMLSVVFNRSSSLAQKLFVKKISERGV